LVYDPKEQTVAIIYRRKPIPVMRCGFTVITLKPNSPDAGRMLLHLAPREQVKRVLLVLFNH
jgi:hypothetical protein